MMNNNNKVMVNGVVKGKAKFDHEVLGEKFYTVLVGVKRRSGVEDNVPVLVSERLWDVNTDHSGERVAVEGEFRSKNMSVDGKSRVLLKVFAKKICEEPQGAVENDENQIVMNGYICKQPSYRMTPLGREICDVMLAVNRGNGKSDYIPCIVWGRNAKYMADRKVGEQFCISGRIQSREYTKMTEEMSEIRIAYEVSVQKIEAGKEVTETEEDFEL